MRQGVWVDEAVQVGFQCTGHLGWATGARAIGEALAPWAGEAMDPWAQRRIGKMECVGDRVEALPCHDIADRWGTTEDTGLLGPLQEGVSGGEGVIGKMPFEGPHGGGLQNKVRQKYKFPTSHHVVTLLSEQSLSDQQ